MKRYEFHSSLPPEMVFAVLSIQAKPWDPLAQGDDTFRFKRKKDGFWLNYMGKFPVNGVVPFCGEVRPAEGGSVITGGFFVWRALWKFLLAVCGIMCLIAPLFGASLGQVLTVVLPLSALWALMCIGFFSWAQQAFFRKRQRAVLEFIERHLLE